MKALRYLNKYLALHKGHLLLGVLCTILAHVCSIVPPRLIRRTFSLIQECATAYQSTADLSLQPVIHARLMKTLLMYSVFTLLAAACRGLCLFLARLIIMVVGKRIEYALKNEIYTHYQTLPLSFYKRQRTGDLLARISEDVGQVGMYLGPTMAYGLNVMVVFMLLIPYMLTLNARLVLYTVLPLLLLAAGTYYVSIFIRQRSEVIQQKLSLLTDFVQDSCAGIGVLQAFNREESFGATFTELCEAYKEQFLRRTTLNTIFSPAAQGVMGLGIILVVFIGGQEVIQGRSTPGNIAEFVMYLYLLGSPIFAINWINNMVQRAAASQTRINAFLQERNTIRSKRALKKPIKGHIVFKDVSFTYPDSGTKGLQGVSFEVKAGEATAIIGTTGSGKSTIAQLTCRLYDVDQGEITIDGTPIQDYEVAYLRQQLGYAAQEILLFSDTLRNNIAWGKPEATDREVMRAAQLAAMDTYILQAPQQLETMLNERGSKLSGGQKQRMAIARALVRTPKILILDDCLSAVDARTARKVLHNIKSSMRDSTILLLTNNTSSAQLMDHMVVMDAGKVVERGTHQELLARGGFYSTLYKQHNVE